MVTTKRERSPTFSESTARQTQLTFSETLSHDLDSMVMAMSYRRFSVLQYVRHNNVIYKIFSLDDITPFEYVVRSYRYMIIGMREGTCFQRM